MPTINSKTLTARIRSEDMDKLEPVLKEKSFSEWVREQINAGASKAKYGDGFTEIESMVSFLGIDLTNFFSMLCNAMVEGRITVSDGELKTKDALDLDKFYDACHEAGVEPQKAIDKMSGMIANGR